MAGKKDIRASRRHRILDARASQLSRNLLVKDGGRPYIDDRLSRFPCESTLSWNGDGDKVPSRPDRAFLINYASRIVTKIGQYVFGQDVIREGIDEAFEDDTTRTGRSVNEFMQDVDANYTAGQWAWIGIDRGTPGIDPETGRPYARSVAEREAAGIS